MTKQVFIINGSGGLKPDDGKKEEKEKSYYSKKENLILRRMGQATGKYNFSVSLSSLQGI